MKTRIRVGIVGVTGFSGIELFHWLLQHPHVEVAALAGSGSRTGPAGELLPAFAGRSALVCGAFDAPSMAAQCEVVFLALPHTVSMGVIPALLQAKPTLKIVDLSADYRLQDLKAYRQWYHMDHADPAGVLQAVYGLPELYKSRIAKAQLIANPGCYPTSAILGLAPLAKRKLMHLKEHIVVDAKSGVTGAGRKVSEDFLYTTVNENLRPYRVAQHQHAPEIQQELDQAHGSPLPPVTFVPHLIPMNRGLLTTSYVRLRVAMSTEELTALYASFYAKAPFVRVKPAGQVPQTSDTVSTNFCDIGLVAVPRPAMAIVVSALDNLGKGAATQAIHNMNIMCGLDETVGLSA